MLKIIFSRKGFDSSKQGGGGPSPIINGQPVSLPIPTGDYPSKTTYSELGLGDYVEKASKCHYDPMFENGRCAFGQEGPAQGHLKNQYVDAGDIFLFFGWFANKEQGDHHRIFGYLEVEKINTLGEDPSDTDQPLGFSWTHPHTLPGPWKPNNTLYVGEGGTANTAHESLRLTELGNPNRSIWCVPRWLHDTRLTYHAKNPKRWQKTEDKEFMRLKTVGRGQEFVANLDNVLDAAHRKKAQEWLKKILAAIKGG